MGQKNEAHNRGHAKRGCYHRKTSMWLGTELAKLRWHANVHSAADRNTPPCSGGETYRAQFLVVVNMRGIFSDAHMTIVANPNVRRAGTKTCSV